MGRALYIDGQNGRTAIEADGPALLVRAEGRADRRYPLGRVGRIVVWGDVVWNHGALCSCLRYGIPIVFHTNGREAAGFGIPARPAEEALTSRLERFSERADARARYEDWLRSEQRRAERKEGPRTGPSTSAPDLNAAIAAFVLKPLTDKGLRLERLAARLPWFRPVFDWTPILVCRLRERPQGIREAASAVEANQRMLRRELEGLARRLAWWLGDMEWNPKTRGF